MLKTFYSVKMASSPAHSFSWTFNNIHEVAPGSCLSSSHHEIGKSKWYLTFYPTGKYDQSLLMASLLLNHEGPVREKVEFSLIVKNQLGGVDIFHKSLNFDFYNNGYGYLDMISIGDLSTPGNGYLVNNSVLVSCIIKYQYNKAALPLQLNTFVFSSDFSDATIRTETESFPVHKIILSMRSPVFKAMLQSSMVEATSNEIIITDFNSSIVKEFIVCLYSTECQLESYTSEVLLELCKIANKYEVKNLQELLEYQIAATTITIDSFISLLTFSESLHCTVLKKALFGFLNKNLTQILAKHKEGLQELFGELSVEFMNFQSKIEN